MTGKDLDIPVEDTPRNNLAIGAALEWLQDNTTLIFDINDIEMIKALPSGVKLFILKYVEIMRIGVGVSSESIAGMSQSFDSSSKAALIGQYATELLDKFTKPTLHIVQAKARWGSN